jgi:hypothetical protein
MCVSCGCGEGADDHGSADNITSDRLENLTDADLKRAADAQGISVEEVRRNIDAAKR